MNVAFCTCRDTKCPLNPVNHDRGCTPCIGKCLRKASCRAAFSTRWPLTGDRTRIIPIRALHSLCWRRSGPARGGPAVGGRGADAISAAGNLRTSTGYFSAMRPPFHAAAAGGIVGRKNSGGYFPAAVFSVRKILFLHHGAFVCARHQLCIARQPACGLLRCRSRPCRAAARQRYRRPRARRYARPGCRYR